ncbi:Uncharacterised protein [Mycobacterium tuberculosis]|uniref:Uncharacterized protein n=1 Tax=Mycobacterium tuberculosis TaxID=1773 RepID=A0A0T7PQZ5_MYCTX|nr:Uncharacterised protein [Mycobacterium tuberculosis]CFS33445.1 Uncharacterised protein [Mycobacterium tuberculosis]COW00927.1 Uncharacterised protein [Mycobacterium tuberculosis]COW24622.1 Uncharacterised protein [Mycobacterium tuberculosis]COW24834.1 Uncharacterised protein [Mycobacterium tuberculosis]
MASSASCVTCVTRSSTTFRSSSWPTTASWVAATSTTVTKMPSPCSVIALVRTEISSAVSQTLYPQPAR